MKHDDKKEIRALFKQAQSEGRHGVPLAQVQKLFRQLRKDPAIPFQYAEEGCAERSYLVWGQLDRLGIAPQKNAWAFKDASWQRLEVEIRKNRKVEWSYHVAPVVKVRLSPRRSVDCVIDPVLFDGPVEVADWAAALGVTAAEVHYAKPGHYPDHRSFGGGQMSAAGVKRRLKVAENLSIRYGRFNPPFKSPLA